MNRRNLPTLACLTGFAVAALWSLRALAGAPHPDLRLAYTSQILGEIDPCG